MTVLGDVLVKNPQALPPEAKEFLNRIASDEEWHEKYIPGNYDSIKPISPASDIVETIPPKTFMKWVLQTCIDANYEAFHAIRDVTSIVWSIRSDGGYVEHPAPAGKSIFMTLLHVFFTLPVVLLLSIPVVSLLFTSVGLLMLLLLLAGIFSLSKNGAVVLPLVVPSVCYNFGTMLLLCGPEARFFHFNVVITLPLLLVLSTVRLNTPAQTT
jgi:hypothetical protein